MDLLIAQPKTLTIPEILSTVLSHLDTDSLKNVRFVSHLWNEEATRIVSSRCWITVGSGNEVRLQVQLTQQQLPQGHQVVHATAESSNKQKDVADIQELQSVLATSANPAIFFKRLQINDRGYMYSELNKLLTAYGHHLTSLKYRYHRSSGENGLGPVTELTIHKVLTDWSPELKELWIFHDKDSKDWMTPFPPLVGPFNLTDVHFKLQCYSENYTQHKKDDFFLDILKLSPKLKRLDLEIGIPHCDRSEIPGVLDFYEKFCGLTQVTNKLQSFSWYNWNSDDLLSLVLTSVKLSNKLDTLRIQHAQLDSTDELEEFFRSNSNLTTLEISTCSAKICKKYTGLEPRCSSQLLSVILRKLPNLDTLVLSGGSGLYLNTTLAELQRTEDISPHSKLNKLISWNDIDHFRPLASFRIHRHQHQNPPRDHRRASSLLSIATVAKYLPNMTVLALKVDEVLMEEFPGMVKRMAPMKNLKNLCLSLYGRLALADLHKSLTSLTAFPNLSRFTLLIQSKFAELPGKRKWIFYNAELQEALLKLKHLDLIRLIGFELRDKVKILDYVEMHGIKLECYRSYKFKDEEDYVYRTLLTDQLSPRTFLYGVMENNSGRY